MVQSGAAWNRFSIAEKKNFVFTMLRLKMLNTIKYVKLSNFMLLKTIFWNCREKIVFTISKLKTKMLDMGHCGTN